MDASFERRGKTRETPRAARIVFLDSSIVELVTSRLAQHDYGEFGRPLLAIRDVEPRNEPSDADLGLLRPAPDEIHDLVPRVMRNPDAGQSSPSVFFNAMCSAINSARTSSLVWIFFSR